MKTIRAADLFCGAGGTSSGLLDACADMGRRLNLLAINHWPVAIETHSANHPYAEHLCESLDVVDPRKVVPGGRLDILVASPECTHHSNARGGKPMSDQSRASAWHVARWAEALSIQSILIENVREFRDWGPLDSRGRPLKRRKGELYHAFLNTLRAMGYTVEDRILNAADYGDPTSRRRLFIIARKGGRQRVTWPEPSHSAKGAETLFGRLPAYRTAREIIDWGNKGQSIFNRARPLSPNTMRRILAGLEKFSGLPFVLGQQSGASPRSVEDPLPTVAGAGAISVIEPFLVPYHREREGQSPRGHSVDFPLPTVATSPIGLVQPFIVGAGGQDLSPESVDAPLGTVLTKNNRALVEPFLVSYHREGEGQPARVNSLGEPLPTIDTSNRFGLAEPFVVKMYGNSDAASIDKPLGTVVGTAKMGIAEPFIVQLEHSTHASGDDRRAHTPDKPLPTVTAQAAFGLAEPFLVQMEHTGKQSDMQHKQRIWPTGGPMPTITSKAHFGLAQPYLVQYNGTSGAQSVDNPLGTVTGVDRFGLCIPTVSGYAVVDILFRMLEPGELARAHSLDDYEFSGTKRDIVKQIGNSVPRRLARALCLAALT